MIYIGAAIAGVLAFFLGALWYGVLFSKAWVRESKVEINEQTHKDAGKYYFLTLVVEIIFAIFIALFLNDVVQSEKVSLFNIAFFIGAFSVLSSLKNYIFERRSTTLILINESYKFIIPFVVVFVISWFN